MGDTAQLHYLPPVTHPVLVFDGVCGLCNRVVRWILQRDRAGQLRFASQQGPAGRALLQQHGYGVSGPDAVVLFEPGAAGVQVTTGARAILRVLQRLGPGYRLLAAMLSIIPDAVLGWFYRAVAQRRYRWFGRLEACRMPAPAERERFLD